MGEQAQSRSALDPRRSDAEAARIDLHAHTCFSIYDGVLTPEELVDAARRVGLAGIAVTDHYDYDDAWKGALVARDYAEKRGDIVVWTGIEYAVEKGAHKGHLLVYFDDPRDLPPRGLTVAELFAHCRARKLLTIHPHPFSSWGIDDLNVIARSPFVELNGDHGEGGPNKRVRREGFRHGWRLVASSDAHDPRQFGSAWTEVNAVHASLRDTLASKLRPVLRGSPIRGIAAKIARVACAPVTLPYNVSRVLAAMWRLRDARPDGRSRDGRPYPGTLDRPRAHMDTRV